MNELFFLIGLALLPAFGNFAGGLLAEWRQPSKRNLSRALHAAAGIILAIVAVELMPRALQANSGWIVGIAFGLGGTLYVGPKAALTRLQGGNGGGRTRMWMIYIAVATDLFSDGLLIGIGSTVTNHLALVLALGQVLADLPEGFATIANLRDKQVPHRYRLLLSAAFVLPVLLAAVVAFWLLRGQGEALQTASLVFVGGLLTVAAVEDMIKEAHESVADLSGSALAVVAGFVLFTFVSAGLGG